MVKRSLFCTNCSNCLARSEVSTRDWGSVKVCGETKSLKMSNKILGKTTKEVEVV